MSQYVCQKHPFVGFYVAGVRYKFSGGEFDTDSMPSEHQTEAERVLQGLIGGVLGITEKPVEKQKFVCQCGAGFPTQARLDAHASKHKTKSQIETESIREGSRQTPSTE